MTKETRVGYMITSILEDMVKDYITAHIIKGIYTGEFKYLQDYQRLREYNK